MGTALGMGAPFAEIGAGLWGFNPALTALAVSVFFVPSVQSYTLAACGACATGVLFGGMKTAFGTGELAFTMRVLSIAECNEHCSLPTCQQIHNRLCFAQPLPFRRLLYPSASLHPAAIF